jgi:esterase
MLNVMIQGSETDRPPLLIAHGLFGSARNWGVIAKRLSDSRKVIAVDMRNHGDSPWHDSHTYPDMAQDLADVLSDQGPADVLGHSMGGKAAMLLALTQPDMVRRLIVADIAPVTYDHRQQHHIAAMRSIDMDRIALRSDAAAQLEATDPDVAAFLLQSLDMKNKRWRLNLDALERNMAAILGFPDVTGHFDKPTLFLSGAASGYVTPAHRAKIKALFPKARFARIPGAGHWVHAEKPREFEAAARTFLDAAIADG